MSDMTTSSIAQLKSFLRGEISAVETYRDVLQKATGAATRAALEGCASSHEARVQSLRQAITSMGGTPAEGSGVWGTFAGLFEGGALVFGGKTGIASLGRGEDHGLQEYRDNFWRLDKPSKELVEVVLLPAQEHTRRAIHDLIKMLS